MGTKIVGIVGDWHGEALWAEMVLSKLHQNNITHILHAGDFGFWPTFRGEHFLDTVQHNLTNNEQTIYVTLGNHEDYPKVNTFVPHPIMEGFVYDPNYDRILVAERGARWEWENVTFVSLGGAASIDYENRIQGVNWWAEERITLGDVYRATQQGHADVMITHECPAGVNIINSHRETEDRWTRKGWEYAEQSRETLKQAVDVIRPEVLIHGHYHQYQDVVVDVNVGEETYSMRNISLDRDWCYGNVGIFDVSTKETRMLSVTGERNSPE